MSTAGQFIGGVVGAVGGFIIGGPTGALYGAQIGITAGGFIDPPKGPKIEGPRLSDLSVQTSTYGAVIPRIYGSVATLGNIFWLENNQLKETEKTETQGGKGGGGGQEVTTYSYSATFALGLCEGPIVGVRRIWAMNKLIYDAGTDDINQLIINNQTADAWKLYRGDDTQTADPRMQAALGAANCPAYRGLAYLMFYDFQLADYGNSLVGAQIKVEVLTAASDQAVSVAQQLALTGTAQLYKSTALACDADGTLHIYRALTGVGTPGNVQAVDYVTGNNSEFYAAQSYDSIGSGFVQGWSDTNRCVFFNSGNGKLYFQSGRNIGTSILGKTNGFQQFSYYERSGDIYLCLQNISSTTVISRIIGGVEYTELVSTAADADGIIHEIFIGKNYRYAVTLTPRLVCYDETWIKLWSVDLTGQFSITNAIGGNDAIIREKADQEVIVRRGNGFWLVNSSGFLSLGSTVPTNIDTYESHGGDHLLWPLWIRYDASTNDVFSIKLDGLQNQTVTLASVVQAECLKSSVLASGDLVTASLTDSVRGYRVASVAAIRSGIEGLQGAFPFDAVQAGYQIKFVRRGAASSVATIPRDDLIQNGGKGELITAAREMDTQLPWRVSVRHLDYSREYDTGEQYAERLNTSSVNVLALDLAIVLTGDEAARIADSLLYHYWLERNTVQFAVPPTYLALEPCDVVTLSAFNGTQTLRIREISYEADGTLTIAAAYASNAVYSSTLSGGTSTVLQAPAKVQGPTTVALLDVPLLRDQDDTAGFPVALCGYGSAWRGANLFSSDDDGQSWTNIDTFATASVIGIATNTIASPATTALIDTASVLSVSLYSGTLSSVTELQMLNGANHFAYGVDGRWEIIAAENCVLQGDGSYQLSNLLRGRFGTEGFTGSHANNDSIVLLSTRTLHFIASNINAIGISKVYRGVTFGYTLESAAQYALTYRAVNLQCLAPVYLNGSRHPTTNDWTLTWIRRTRIGGEWRDSVDATLGETSEAYEVEIYSSNTYTTLKRTLTGLTSATATYTSANQVTDFGSNQATLYVKVYQISSVTGRGTALTASITR